MEMQEHLIGIQLELIREYKEHVKKGNEIGNRAWIITRTETDTPEYDLHEIEDVALHFDDEETRLHISHMLLDFITLLSDQNKNPVGVIVIYDCYISKKRHTSSIPKMDGLKVVYAGENVPNVLNDPNRTRCVISALYMHDFSYLELHPFDIIGQVVIFKDAPPISTTGDSVLKNPFHLSK